MKPPPKPFGWSRMLLRASFPITSAASTGASATLPGPTRSTGMRSPIRFGNRRRAGAGAPGPIRGAVCTRRDCPAAAGASRHRSTAANGDGNNALWLACYSGHVELIDLLIASGIEIDRQNDNGATCLMYAASSGKIEVVMRLLAGGASLDLTSLDDFSALDMAANIQCLQLLSNAARRQRQGLDRLA